MLTSTVTSTGTSTVTSTDRPVYGTDAEGRGVNWRGSGSCPGAVLAGETPGGWQAGPVGSGVASDRHPHPAETPGFEPLDPVVVEVEGGEPLDLGVAGGDRFGLDVPTAPSAPDPIPDGGPQGAIGGLVAALGALDRAAAGAVAAAAACDGARVVAEEGMTLEAAIRAHVPMVRGDVNAVLSAAEVLAGMPVTAGLFARGVLSWGHVRALTSQARHLDVTTRRAVDTHLGAHAARLARLDGDQRLAVIDDTVLEYQPVEVAERRTERDLEARHLVVTPRLDGSGTLFGDLDVEGFAAVTARLDEEADTPRVSPSPGDGPDMMGRQVRAGDTSGSRARLLADALVRICERPTRDGGAGGSVGVGVRFTVTVDAALVSDTIAGTIRPALAARPPRIVRRAMDRLACDAALDVVVRDGADLLAAHRFAPELTASVRRAIAARDEGCRFPGCRAPVSWCDVHHVTPRATGDDHALANLVALCRRHHTTVHRRGWAQHLTPDGTYQLTRRNRTWTTLPRNQHHLPPPPHTHTNPTRAGPGDHSPARAGPGHHAPTRAGPATTARPVPVPASSTNPWRNAGPTIDSHDDR